MVIADFLGSLREHGSPRAVVAGETLLVVEVGEALDDPSTAAEGLVPGVKDLLNVKEDFEQEPFERQVQLEAPLGAVPQENGEHFRDGMREDKLKFYRAKVRGQERVFEDLSIDVWTSPDGAAVEGVRRQEVAELAAAPAVKEDILELQLLGGKCADLGDAAVSLSGCAIAARVPSGAPRLLRNQRGSTSRGVSGHRDWHGGVVGSPVLGLRSTGRCSARGDNAYQDHAGGTRGSTKQLCQWIKEQQVVAPPAETPSPVLSGTVEFRGPLGAPRLLRDQRASVVRGLLGAPRLLRDQRLVRHVSVEDLIDAPSVKDLSDVAFVEDLSGAESVKDLIDAPSVEGLSDADSVKDLSDAHSMKDLIDAPSVEDICWRPRSSLRPLTRRSQRSSLRPVSRRR